MLLDERGVDLGSVRPLLGVVQGARTPRQAVETVGMSSRRVVVAGTVQGVGFRWSARTQAERLGVRGWVRNRDDGRVEALLTGDDDAVEELLAWFRAGPPGAVVTSADVEVAEDEALDGFAIRH